MEINICCFELNRPGGKEHQDTEWKASRNHMEGRGILWSEKGKDQFNGRKGDD
jgi:hypothetical protein